MHTVRHHLLGKIPVITVELPDSPTAMVSVCFPFGSISDPQGKSGLTNLAAACRIESTDFCSAEELGEALATECLTLTSEVREYKTSYSIEGPNEALDSIVSHLVSIVKSYDYADFAEIQSRILAKLKRVGSEDEISVFQRAFLSDAQQVYRPVDGTEREVRRITLDDVQAHMIQMEMQYTPVIIIFSAEIHPQMLDAALPFSALEFDREFIVPPYTAFDSSVFMAPPKLLVMPSPETRVSLAFPVNFTKREEVVAYHLFGRLLEKKFNDSELSLESVAGYVDTMDAVKGMFTLDLVGPASGLVDALRVTMTHLSSLVSDLCSAADLEIAKKTDLYGVEIQCRSIEKIERLSNFYELQKIMNFQETLPEVRSLIRGMTPEKIRGYASTLFAQSGACCWLLGNPDEKTISEMAVILSDYAEKYNATLPLSIRANHQKTQKVLN